MNIINLTNKKCFFHKWIKIKDNGFTSYFECLKCGSRKIYQKSGGYQPINWNWFKFKPITKGI